MLANTVSISMVIIMIHIIIIMIMIIIIIIIIIIFFLSFAPPWSRVGPWGHRGESAPRQP